MKTLNSQGRPGELDSMNTLGVGRGLVKFDLATPLERFFLMGGILTLVAGLALLKIGFLGGRHSRPEPALLPYVPWALLISLVFFAIRFFTDNYYLVDSRQKLVYYHFKCLWFSSVRLRLRRADILAVATLGRKRRRRYSSWWAYEVVVIGADGRLIPFSDSKREALEECNAQAKRLGAMLDCAVYKSPPCRELDVKVTNGNVSVSF